MAIPKRILFLSATSEIGGAEKVLLLLAGALDPKKYEICFITQSPGALATEFAKIGQEVIFLPLPAWRKTKNIISRYLALFQLLRLIRVRGIELIHCNSCRLAPYVVHCSRFLKIPGIIHLHELVWDELIQKFNMQQASSILTVSEFARQPFLNYPVLSRTIHNGISVAMPLSSENPFRKEFAIPDGTWIIGMIANFTENKRPGKFIEIASHIKKLHSQVRFVIVGHNPWNSAITSESLREQAKQFGIADEMILTGWREDVPAILSSFDSLIVPSKVEAFPLVVLEAMASKVVVFANAAAGGPKEQIVDGKEGFLVDCDQPQMVAEKIVSVLRQPELRKHITGAAAKRVQAEFNMPTFIRNIENFYDSILTEKKV